ncbi:hypothetical protein HYALB_00006710 [Hymenoscyphus albidus]|uniref:LYC1 C-terminal domain-containing protein n=1 Tax=Hymenoscyphus albidus TaxID=595503 RepID=A0A9N9PTW7_9HELO|nr:hypothetical protein HYALB_00006710 [Hymenoscyphus albidus]
MADLPLSTFPNLGLAYPTKAEQLQIWTLNSKNWGTNLSLPDYLEREEHLSNMPQTRDGGITHWILTDKTLPENSRPILSSCESLRRHAIISYPNGTTKEVITHGIGSVFCSPDYRGRGYAGRMLSLVREILRTHQKDIAECPFSILYSDIGKKFYSGLGWKVFASSHISIPALRNDTGTTNGTTNGTANGTTVTATPLTSQELPDLIAQDCTSLKALVPKIAKSTNKPSLAIYPDAQTIEWHHLRESFMASKLFPNRPLPTINGAISTGDPGSRVWIIFTRVFGDKFYILRLVMEDSTDSASNAEKLSSVLNIAREEAAKWDLNSVVLWNVSDVVKNLLARARVAYQSEERETDSIPSLMWYGDGEGGPDAVEWVANEKFAWC